MSTSRARLMHLNAWRTWKGFSQRELSQMAHVARATIAHLEHDQGKANYVTVAKLAIALGLSREQLLHEGPKSG